MLLVEFILKWIIPAKNNSYKDDECIVYSNQTKNSHWRLSSLHMIKSHSPRGRRLRITNA